MKFKNLGEREIFIEKYNLPKMNQEEAKSLDIPITCSETELLINKLPAQKSPEPDGFTEEFYKNLRRR